MWLPGLVLGALLGVLFGDMAGSHGMQGFWGIVCGMLGLYAGARLDRRRALDERRFDLLEKAIVQLSQRLAVIENGRGQVDRTEAAADVAPAPAIAAPQPEAVVESVTLVSSRPVPETTVPDTGVASGTTPEAMPETASLPDWMRRYLGGNILAKIGVILLFFGIASGLRLAIEAGLFPVSVRLMLGAAVAVVMCIFGYGRAQQPEHRLFGLALQGGGCAILYLIVYFMLARYELIGMTPAFILFALIGVGCMMLAIRQDDRWLAVLGMSGAFLAPKMAASLGEGQIVLFSYFLLLNAFIVAVSWFKGWRALNLAGFVFTLLIGMNWALNAYQPQDFPVSETFLVLFFLLFSATPVLFNLFDAPGRSGWSDGMLLFGTPLAAALLQYRLLSGDDLMLAWHACFTGIYYLYLWRLMEKQAEQDVLMAKGLLAIALGFFTIAIPLAFDARLTSAFWTLEGYGVLYFGIRQNRPLARLAGGAMQFVAGIYFLLHMNELGHALAVFNDVYIGCGIVALAGMASALQLRSADESSQPHAPLFLYWSLIWWFASGFAEIDRFVAQDQRMACWLALASASFAGLEWLGTRRAWPAMRLPGVLLLPLAMLAALEGHARYGHALHGVMIFLLPLTLVIHYGLLQRHDSAGLPALRIVRHAVSYWLLLALAGSELVWVAQQLAPGVELWPLLAWGCAASAGILICMRGVQLPGWPFAAWRHDYLATLQYPVVPLLCLWLLVGNLTHAGGGSGLPYLPLLNPFDLAQLLAMFALWRWLCARENREWLPILPVVAFIWISMEAARITHHWGGVPFRFRDLFESAMMQASLSLLWTAIAMTLMIHASRHGKRTLWFGGFGLLSAVGAKLMLIDLSNKGTVLWTLSLIGIALLVIATSYFSPAPPKTTTDAPEQKDRDAP